MGSKQLGSKSLERSQICSHTPSALNAGAKRSEATCHMAMPQCCYLAKVAKRPSHSPNTIKFDCIPFDPCNSIKRFDLCPFDQKNSTYLQSPNFFVESFGLKVLSQVTTKLSQLHSNSRNEYVNSRKYHNVGHMLALVVAKTSSHFDRFAIFVPARSLHLFDLA